MHSPSILDLFRKQIVFIDIRDYAEEDCVRLDVTSNAEVAMEKRCAEHLEFQALTCAVSISDSYFGTLSCFGKNCSIKLSDIRIEHEADIFFYSGSLYWSHASPNMFLDIKTLNGSASYKGKVISSPGMSQYGKPRPKIPLKKIWFWKFPKYFIA